MIDTAVLLKAWTILDKNERRNAVIVAIVVFVAALFSAVAVASVIPFLAVLADPEKIREQYILNVAYEVGRFQSSESFLIALGLASILVIGLGNAFQILRIYVVARYATMRMHSISIKLLSSYLRRPYLFFLSRNSGDMGTQILSESHQVVERCIRPAAEGFAAVLSIACLTTLLLYVEPLISIVSFMVIGIIYGSIALLTRSHIRRLGQIRASSNVWRFRLANESLSGIRDVKQLSREQHYLSLFRHPSHEMARCAAQISMISQIPQFVITAIAFSGMILLCVFLIDPDSADDSRSIGGIVPTLGFLALAGQKMLPEMSRLFQSVTRLASAGPALDAIYREIIDDIDTEKLLVKPPTALGLTSYMSLADIDFRYPGSEKLALESVSFSISAGERIGIVGGTGSGKTTLANIILGMLIPANGELRVDDKIIVNNNRRSWQATIGYVPQEIFLTDGTIAANIAFGRSEKEIDLDRVRKAAQIASIDDFIQRDLDNGYDTVVGERGVRLSGGQRQRVGIARALYNEADLILFDEATSALDNATEKDVTRSIESLPGDKTIIMIAHRMTTLRGCDRIIVLKHGRVVAIDAWQRLYETCSEFRRIANAEGRLQ